MLQMRLNYAIINELIDKLDELSREASRVMDLEEELLIAKEVSIRLHTELEQAQEWRNSTDLLNKELKKQLDELKDYLDNEVFTYFITFKHSNKSNFNLNLDFLNHFLQYFKVFEYRLLQKNHYFGNCFYC